MSIYAEYLVLENFIINFIILYIVKKYTGANTTKSRMVIGALTGALYTLVVFFPQLYFLAKLPVKLAVSVLIIILAFNPERIRDFMKLIATFYVVSFVFAGASLALIFIFDVNNYTENGIFYIDGFSIGMLFLAIFISFILIKFVWGYIKTKLKRKDMYVPISIILNRKIINITALMDTGNSLKDPVTDVPVIIAQFSEIKELLPYDVQQFFSLYKEDNLNVLWEVMSKSMDNIKFRIIPFKSLGKENGILLGFKPDKVVINTSEKTVISDIIVGIYNSDLSSTREYSALLHPELLS
ncbi:sigma-E processing peptidase SpoIIGA [Clostridiisalibacter paucivorans]|uniref:sigma-E processing peptidase SpoIIGA n=1 Tax=Clostridiisalibacter paucivorans TaxID=408753 RepID=UPI00047DF7FF|nr:sigma-E processing peptidase SpoIIGA [Clostridiisalibacter paucivorans]